MRFLNVHPLGAVDERTLHAGAPLTSERARKHCLAAWVRDRPVGPPGQLRTVLWHVGEWAQMHPLEECASIALTARRAVLGS